MARHVTINGTTESLVGRDPTAMLLQHLRASGRTGTKEGCAEGDCGACTVAMLGPDGAFQAVNSCLLPLGAAAGRTFVTVEGVAPDRERLHPVQQALVETGGSQCGYCTPGFVMSMFAAYYEGAYARTASDDARESDQDRLHAIDGVIEGNLCRCTGYLPIRRAAAALGEPHPDDPHLHIRAHAPTPAAGGDGASLGTSDHGGAAEPALAGAGTCFYLPSTLAEALELLAEHEDARPIAGGTDLGVDLTKFHRRFPHLVSLERVPELHALDVEDDEVRIGGATPLTRIERELRGTLPALDEMLRWFAARQIRNRATLGGNLGTASPIGDLPPVLLAFDAGIELASRAGRRTVPVSEYFLDYRQTARRRDELVVAVRIPIRPDAETRRRHAWSYKVGKRGTDDISIVAACFRIDIDRAGVIRHARLAYGGVAAVPIRARSVEDALVGRPWTEATVREAARALRDAFTPLDDHRGSAAYRRALAGNLFEKFRHEHPESS